MRFLIPLLAVLAAGAADVSVTVPDTLPEAAQKEVDKYNSDVAKIHADAENLEIKRANELAKVLQKVQDDLTRHGDLQRALALKAKIASLPLSKPGVDVLGNKEPALSEAIIGAWRVGPKYVYEYKKDGSCVCFNVAKGTWKLNGDKVTVIWSNGVIEAITRKNGKLFLDNGEMVVEK
jgi:hypothetical protein